MKKNYLLVVMVPIVLLLFLGVGSIIDAVAAQPTKVTNTPAVKPTDILTNPPPTKVTNTPTALPTNTPTPTQIPTDTPTVKPTTKVTNTPRPKTTNTPTTP